MSLTVWVQLQIKLKLTPAASGHEFDLTDRTNEQIKLHLRAEATIEQKLM